MSDSRRTPDEELRQHVHDAVDSKVGDWTFTPSMRAAVQREVARHARSGRLARTGRLVRDAGWVVGAAAVVFLLASRGGLGRSQTQSAREDSKAAYSTFSTSSAPSTAPEGSGSTGDQSAKRDAASSSSSMAREQTAATTGAQQGSSQDARASKTTQTASAQSASTPADGAPTVSPVMTTLATTASPGHSDTDTTARAPDQPDSNPAAKVAAAPTTPTENGANAVAARGFAVMASGSDNSSVPAARPFAAQVLTAPTHVGKVTAAVDLAKFGEQGTGLQVTQDSILLFARSSNGPAVQAFDTTLQPRWTHPQVAQMAIPSLQPQGALAAAGSLLTWQRQQILLTQGSGAVQWQITLAEPFQLRGLHVTGERWLTVIGSDGSGSTAIWVADLNQGQVSAIIKLPGEATDAVALDAAHVVTLTTPTSLQIVTDPEAGTP